MKGVIITVLIILFVVGVVYGASQFIFHSAVVEYGIVEGYVEFSTDQQVWSKENITVFEGCSWFARFVTSNSGYRGNVSITWTLQKFTDGSWKSQAVTRETYAHLTGKAEQYIYVNTYGYSQENNFDWGSAIADIEANDKFRVVAYFATIEGSLP